MVSMLGTCGGPHVHVCLGVVIVSVSLLSPTTHTVYGGPTRVWVGVVECHTFHRVPEHRSCVPDEGWESTVYEGPDPKLH